MLKSIRNIFIEPEYLNQMQLAIKIALFILLFLILFSLLTFFMSIHPPKIITNLIPSDLGLEYEEITFKSTDGINLSGWLIPNNKAKKTIIVMHGYPADKANLLGIAEFLAKDFNFFCLTSGALAKAGEDIPQQAILREMTCLEQSNIWKKKKTSQKSACMGFRLVGLLHWL